MRHIPLSILLIGNRIGPSYEIIRSFIGHLQQHPAIKKYGGVDFLPDAWRSLSQDLPNTIILDTALLNHAFGNFGSIEEFVRDVRISFPYIVFILFNSNGQLIVNSAGHQPDRASGIPNLEAYYQITDIDNLGDPLLPPAELLNCLRYAEASFRLTHDIAISYAGVEFQFADELAKELKANGVRVYFDREHPAEILGHNLPHFLGHIYGSASRHFVPVITHAYLVNEWTRYEMTTAIDTGIRNRGQDFILQVRLHNLLFPGLPENIAYIPVGKTIPEITDLLIQKLWLIDSPGTRINFGHFEFDVL